MVRSLNQVDNGWAPESKIFYPLGECKHVISSHTPFKLLTVDLIAHGTPGSLDLIPTISPNTDLNFHQMTLLCAFFFAHF